MIQQTILLAKLINQSFKELRQSEEGATLTEFGFIAGPLCLLLMGLFDAAHTQYTSALLTGAMQKAGRDLTLESAGSTEGDIDAAVEERIRLVAPKNADIKLKKLSHFDFSDVGEAELFDDINEDGICNNNERYEDANGNGEWDEDRGLEGIGGARDVVLYEASVSYSRLFPLAGLVRLVGGQSAMDDSVTLTASTVLRNQPYDEQSTVVVESRNCNDEEEEEDDGSEDDEDVDLGGDF